MTVQQILTNVRKFRMWERSIAVRLPQNPPHPDLADLVVLRSLTATNIVFYDVLMPGSVQTEVEKAASPPPPSAAYKMRRFFYDTTAKKPDLRSASYGVDMSHEAIVRLASRSDKVLDVDKIKEQMTSALDVVQGNDRFENRSFRIQTPKGPVLAVGRRYGAAYVDRYVGGAEEEREALERSLADDKAMIRAAKIQETARLEVPAEKIKGVKRRDQDQL
jgi:hypothetical protein